MIRARYGAGVEQWTHGIPDQARRGDQSVDEAPGQYDFRKSLRLVSERWAGPAPTR